MGRSAFTAYDLGFKPNFSIRERVYLFGMDER